MKKISYAIFICLIIDFVLLFRMLYFYTKDIEDEVEDPYNKIYEANKKEKYECNEFSYVNLSVQSLVSAYFDDYFGRVLYKMEDGYEKLDPDYRNLRFGSLEAYKQYLYDMEEVYFNAKVKSYKINEYDNYTQYVIVDNYDNYYIFNATAVMQYTVILDSYTYKLNETVNKYEKASVKEKICMDLEIFKEMINTKDYKAAYNLLESGFKSNYFPTLESFEKYMKENFFEYSKFEYSEYKEVGESYVVTVNAVDKMQNSKEVKVKDFVVILEENNEFKMSFSVK